MKPSLQSLIGQTAQTDFGLQLLDFAIKVSALLAVLLAASLFFRSVFRCSAAQRASLVWIGALAIPVIAITSFRSGASSEVIWEVPLTAPTIAAPVAAESLPVAATEIENSSTDLQPVVLAESEITAAPLAVINEPALDSRPIAWDRWFLIVWLCGTLAIVLRLVIGIARLNWQTRRLVRIADRSRIASTLDRICGELGIRNSPELVLARDPSAMPMTWGAWRHKILLPADASDWSDERLAFVLRHELGHVRRRDCLASWIMHLLLAAAWFHPLAWLLGRHATNLRERACDDLSTRGGEEVDDYARELVAISKRNITKLGGALAMARPRRLEGRIRALYCERVGRNGAGRFFRTCAAALVGIFVLPALVFTLFQSTQLLAAPKANADIAYLRPERQVEMGYSTILHFEDAWEGSETRDLEEIDKVVQKWVQRQPRLMPDKATPISEVTLRQMNHRGHLMGIGYPNKAEGEIVPIPNFPEGKTQAGMIYDAGLEPNKRLSLGDIKVVYLDGQVGKISVQFKVQTYKSVNGKSQPSRKFTVGPMTIDNGGGIVLGVTGEKKEEQYETAVHKLPILRGIAKRQRKNLRRYKTIEVLAFSVAEKDRPWVRNSPVRSVSPRPKFRPGDKQVDFKFVSFHDSSLLYQKTPDHMAKAAESVRKWRHSGIGSLSGGRPAPATELAFLHQLRSSEAFEVPKFTLGKSYTCKAVNPYSKSDGTMVDMGFSAKLKVSQRRDGKLSVEITPSHRHIAAMTPEEIEIARKTKVAPPERIVHIRGSSQTFVIDNGGGILLGKLRDEVQVTEDKVPFLGDLPLIKRVFSSTAENHYSGMAAIQISVAAPRDPRSFEKLKQEICKLG